VRTIIRLTKTPRRPSLAFAPALILGLLALTSAAPAHAADKLLDETVDFTGTVLFLSTKVPGMVIGVIRDGQTSVHGYGKIADGSDKEPDGNTLMRVGSITKVFTTTLTARARSLRSKIVPRSILVCRTSIRWLAAFSFNHSC